MLTLFCLGNISDGFSTIESREVSLNENVQDFSVDYDSINKWSESQLKKMLLIKCRKTVVKEFFKKLETKINLF